MNITLHWNCDPSNKEKIENDILSEIESFYRLNEINAKDAVVSVNSDPLFSNLIGSASSDGEIVLTFTYSLTSHHKATYKKVT